MYCHPFDEHRPLGETCCVRGCGEGSTQGNSVPPFHAPSHQVGLLVVDEFVEKTVKLVKSSSGRFRLSWLSLIFLDPVDLLDHKSYFLEFFLCWGVLSACGDSSCLFFFFAGACLGSFGAKDSPTVGLLDCCLMYWMAWPRRRNNLLKGCQNIELWYMAGTIGYAAPFPPFC